jgi:hypothetical protein
MSVKWRPYNKKTYKRPTSTTCRDICCHVDKPENAVLCKNTHTPHLKSAQPYKQQFHTPHIVTSCKKKMRSHQQDDKTKTPQGFNLIPPPPPPPRSRQHQRSTDQQTQTANRLCFNVTNNAPDCSHIRNILSSRRWAENENAANGFVKTTDTP